MRAARYARVGGPVTLDDVPEPDCPPDGAIISVRATGVCRSDWHAWRGHERVALPHVPGHEFAGVVAAFGESVQDFVVGDRVTAPFVNGCGHCSWCRSGSAQVCPDQTQPGFTHPGSFAELVVVRAADTNLVRLPAAVDDVAAAALGCRLATAYRGLSAHARLTAGEQLAVFGCGGVGLSAIMIGVALGARVIAVDPSSIAVDRAIELGAEVGVTEADAVSEVRRVSDGGVAVSVDAYGSTTTAEAAVRSLRRRGRHVQIGLMLGPDAHASLPWDLVIAHELGIHGSHGMAAGDYPQLLELITTGRLDPRRLVGRVIGMDELPAALMAMDSVESATAGTTVAVLSDRPLR